MEEGASMKKSSGFFKKLHRLYLTLGFGLGLSFIGFSTLYLPQNPVALKLDHQKLEWEIVKSFAEYESPLKIKHNTKNLKKGQYLYRYNDIRVMDATAYYPGPECTGKYSYYGRTYTGKKADYGLVAVDPRVIPLGTKLYIEGYGYAEAADIGGAIKGNRIDLCFQTYREAKRFGRKKVKVYIFRVMR
jgi:3D (Asp-Asp-Asp) domain-containing protein